MNDNDLAEGERIARFLGIELPERMFILSTPEDAVRWPSMPPKALVCQDCGFEALLKHFPYKSNDPDDDDYHEKYCPMCCSPTLKNKAEFTMDGYHDYLMKSCKGEPMLPKKEE